MMVPNLELEVYQEGKNPNRSHIVHRTFPKNIKGILQYGLNRQGRNHIHFTNQDALSRTKQKKGADIAIIVNVPKAKLDGLKFYKTANGVIVSPGNDDGIISPRYFTKVQNTKIGELIDFKNIQREQISTEDDEGEIDGELFAISKTGELAESREWTIVMKEEEKLNEQSIKVSEDEAYDNILAGSLLHKPGRYSSTKSARGAPDTSIGRSPTARHPAR